MEDHRYEIVTKDDFFWVKIYYTPSSRQEVLVDSKNTNLKAVQCYFRKAKQLAERILKDFPQTKNRLQSKVRKGSCFQTETHMNLIRIRNNKIHLDFRYRDPVSGKSKRHRETTGLENSRQNQLQAKQLALAKLDALSKPKQTQSTQSNHIVQVSSDVFLTHTGVPIQYTSVQNSKTSIEQNNCHTLADFVEYYKTRKKFLKLSKRSQKTYSAYLRLHIVKNLGIYPLKDIDSDIIEDFEMDLIDSNLSPKSIKDIIGVLRMLLNFAVHKRKIPYCPHYTPSTKHSMKRPKHLSVDERDRFLKYVKEYDEF